MGKQVNNKIKSALNNKRRHRAQHDAIAACLQTSFNTIKFSSKPKTDKRNPLENYLKPFKQSIKIYKETSYMSKL